MNFKKEFFEWQQDPGKMRKRFLYLNIIWITFYSLYIFGEGFRDLVNTLFWHPEAFPPLVIGYLLPFLPAGGYLFVIRRVQNHMVHQMIAEKMQWKYEPENMPFGLFEKTRSFGAFMGPWVREQFSGEYDGVSFVSGAFSMSKFGKIEKYQNMFFCVFQVKNSLPRYFCLQPQTRGAKLKNIITQNDIDTESTRFNNAFECIAPEGKTVSAEAFLQSLTPSVIQRLTIGADQFKNFKIIFRDEFVVFLYDNNPLSNMKTSFLRQKAIHVDEADVASLESHLQSMLGLYADISQYIK